MSNTLTCENCGRGATRKHSFEANGKRFCERLECRKRFNRERRKEDNPKYARRPEEQYE